MKAVTTRLWIASNIALGCLATISPSTAQIVPDNTLPVNSIVTPGCTVCTIDGGTIRGTNLFHSFNEFSVPTRGEAFFNNGLQIQNIFSRVTGNSVSNIDGVLRANGTANLFLLNPNGIIFGANATLNLGGSFFASTAISLVFADGTVFSAKPDTSTPPLLTISVPLGLQYGSNPGSIQVKGATLEVGVGQTLALVGGNVQLNGGALDTPVEPPGGRVELGGLAEEGIVELVANGEYLGLSFPVGVPRGDVSLSNGAVVDVVAGGGGSIGVNAFNLTMTQGSQLRAGIASDWGSVDAVAGDIEINATGAINLTDESRISNDVEDGALGNGGNINITTGSLRVTNGTQLSARTFGQGNAGNVTLNARDTVSFDRSYADSTVEATGVGNGGNINITTGSLSLTNGARLNVGTSNQGNGGTVNITADDTVSLDGVNGLPSAVLGNVEINAIGNAGNINITAGSLFVTNGALIESRTRGQGNAGNVTLNARNTVSVDGVGSFGSSSVYSSLESTGVGSGGDIKITTGALSVTNGGQLNASTTGQGNGGNINITTAQLRVSDGSRVNASTSGTGNGGNLTINASQSVQLIGTSPRGFSSFLFTLSTAGGNAGELTINTGTLLIRDGAQILAGTFGSGNGGNVTVNASQDVQLIGTSAIGLPSRLRASAEKGSSGNAGNLTINTGTLLLRDAAQVGAGTFGSGNGGNLTVNASQEVQLIGLPSPVNDLFSIGTGLFASTAPDSSGNGGDLTINTSNLLVRDGAQVSTGTSGTGNGGKLTVNASQEVQLIGTTADGQFASGLFATDEGSSSGKAGDVTINTGTLLVRDGAGAAASTYGSGKGGNLTVKASDSVQLSGTGGLFARSTSGSTAGNLTVETRQMSVQDGSQVTVSSPQGQAGNLNITANSLSLNRGKLTAETGASGTEGANINLSGLDLVLMQNESLISAQAFNQANGGNINIDTKLLVALPAVGSNGSDIIASAGQGNGGKITINADGIFGIRERKAIPGNRTNDIDASSEFGSPGTVALNTSLDPSRGLSQLPEEPVDPTKQISQQCAARGEDQNKFTITGRGGLPQSPTEVISPDMVLDDFGTPVVSNPPTGESLKPSPSNPPQQLVEAQGWVIDDLGVVTLVAAAPTVTPHPPALVLPSCDIRGTTGKRDQGIGTYEELAPVRYR